MAAQPNIPDEPQAPASGFDDDLEPISVVEEHIETVRVRRSPKYSVFLGGGAALGVVVAMILTFTFSGTGSTSPNTGLVYSSGQVFGFLLLICITVGVVVGGVVALLLDRALAKRTRDVIVDRESVRVED
jgi:Na+/pantothenate symporter